MKEEIYKILRKIEKAKNNPKEAILPLIYEFYLLVNDRNFDDKIEMEIIEDEKTTKVLEKIKKTILEPDEKGNYFENLKFSKNWINYKNERAKTGS